METIGKKPKVTAELQSKMRLPLMEEFFSIQGEGFNTGRPAYFIRVGGCDVGCHWCDVKESWDASLHPLTETSRIIENVLTAKANAVVVTGGEPCMYDLSFLTRLLKENGIQTFLETSGAYEITGEWDWICLSPKKNMPVLNENFSKADELKMIIYNKDDFRFAETCAEQFNSASPFPPFSRSKRGSKNSVEEESVKCLFLQPEWSRRNEMLPLIVDFVLKNPFWRISLQTHKYIGIP